MPHDYSGNAKFCISLSPEKYPNDVYFASVQWPSLQHHNDSFAQWFVVTYTTLPFEY